MVNVPNIKRVIASIRGELPETEHLGFNMGGYVNPSSHALPDHSGRNLDWVACVGGHAYILCVGCSFQQAMFEEAEEIEEVAQSYLGLTDRQADSLFFDLPVGMTLACIPPDIVIAVLESLAVTNEVRWEDEIHAVAA